MKPFEEMKASWQTLREELKTSWQALGEELKVSWRALGDAVSASIKRIADRLRDQLLGPITTRYDRASIDYTMTVAGHDFTVYTCVKKVGRPNQLPAMIGGIMLVEWPAEFNTLFSERSQYGRDPSGLFVWGNHNADLNLAMLLAREAGKEQTAVALLDLKPQTT